MLSDQMAQRQLHFSVVIPVYNGSSFIKDAIDSCLQQTLQPFEIIVIDDASADDTGQIVQKIQSLRIKYIRNVSRKGPSFSRNHGMRLATGNWISFLDADDRFHPFKLEMMNTYILKNPDIKGIGHSFVYTDVPEEYMLKPVFADIQPVRKTVFNVLMHNPSVTPALTVSKMNRLFFNEEMQYAEDHDYILRTTESYGFWYLDLPLCLLGRKPLTAGGLSSRRWEMRKGEIKMYMAYCRRNRIWLLAPLLVLFSLGKHIRSMLMHNNS
jgi:teichuronic acid biosynthesis glycosyltransferase TuaG